MNNELIYVDLNPIGAGGSQTDFLQIFGRSGPIHIEIGTGKATFLLNQGRAQPNVNFLGIERANKYYRYSVDRIGRWGLTNVRIIHADAAVFLADSIPDSSIDCFHIYFPDPWPKRRHHKRRFLCPANMEHLVRCLKPGGTLRIATDHAEYFEQIRKLITGTRLGGGSPSRSGIGQPFGSAQACPPSGLSLRVEDEQGRGGRLLETDFLPAVGCEPGELTGTNYERKYIKDKRKIYTIAAMKK